MNLTDFIELFGFGSGGWGGVLAYGALLTLVIALCGMAFGCVLGIFGTWAKVSGGPFARHLADAYTTVVRGVPDLLIIYLVYFGSSSVLTYVGALFGQRGFVGIPSFVAGTIAIGVISGALSTEVFRGAFNAVNKGEIEAAKACGMTQMQRFRRIIAPLTLRHAMPGMGNVWISALKETSLLSVIGLAELMRQAQVAAGSTRLPFDFYLAAAALYVLLATLSSVVVQKAERRYAPARRGKA